jgi:RNase P subunit RPR2
VEKLDDRMIMVVDLVDKLNGNLVKQLVHKKDLTNVFNIKPDICPHCHSTKMHGIEIMGANSGVLLWECSKCLDIYLKYDSDKTERELQNASKYWTNSSDWGKVPRAEFN